MAQNIDFDLLMRDRGATATGAKFDKTLTGLDGKQKKVSKSAAGMWKQFAVGLGATTAITLVARKLVTTFTDGIKAAADFEKEMANVSTLVDTSAVSMGAFEQGILDMAGELGSATDLTQGLYQALSAGVEPAKALEFVGESAKFAKAALTDTLGAVDLLSTVLNAYGMEASEAANVSDILFQTIKDGKTTGELLAGAMGRIIPTAATMGINLETVSAVLATMTKGGTSTDEAVTALNQTLMAVLKPGAEAAKTAKQLGLDFSKAGIEGAGGFEKWLIKLKAAVGDNETKMAKLFPNVRALKAVFALTGAQAGEFTRIMGNMADVSGNVDEAFKKQQETAAATMDAIKNEMSAAFTELLLPALRDFSSWVRDNKETIIATFTGIIEVFKGIVQWAGMVVNAVVDMVNSFEKNFPNIARIGKGIAEGWGKIFTLPETFKNVDELGRQSDQIISTLEIMQGQAATSQEKFKDFFSTLDNDAFIKLHDAIGPIPTDFKDGGDQAHYFNKIMIDIAQGKHGEALAADFKKFNTELKALADRGPLEKALSSFESLGIISKETSKGILDFTGKIKDTFTPMETITIKVPKLTDETKKLKEETEKLKEETEKLKEETENLASSMGILTEKGYKEQSENIKNLLSFYTQYETQIASNKDTLKTWVDEIDELSKTALPAEKEALGKVRAEMILGYGEQNKVIVSVGDYNAHIMESLSMLSPWTQAIYRNRDALYAQRLIMVGIATNNLPMLMEAWEMMGLKMTGVSNAVQNNSEATKKWIPDFKNAGDVAQWTGNILGSVENALSSMGLEIDEGTKKWFEFGEGLVNVFAGIVSKNPAGIIQGVTQAVSSLISIISGESGELEAARRRMSGLQMSTEGWGAKIEELAKQLGGADSAGRAFNSLLADMIRDSDITVGNFDNYITKVREIVSAYEDGNATIEETQRNFGAAFDAIIQSAQTLGIEGSQSLRGLIELAGEFGLSVQEISDYINANMKTALGGWQEAIITFGDFSIPIFDDMLALQGKIADNQQLIDSIHGANQAMMDLAKTPNFAEDQFAVFQNIAVDAMQRLEASGFSAAQAMESDAGLRGMLQNIIFLSEQYGFKVDDNTQALIDQGVASGALTAQQQTEGEIMIDGFDRMIGRMDKLIGLMGGEMPDAVDEMARRSIAAIDGISQTTTQWGSSLGGVNSSIGDVIDSIDTMGDTHDDVMRGRSIIPDTEEWEKKNWEIERQLKDDMVSAIGVMGDEFDYVIGDMMTGTGGMYDQLTLFEGDVNRMFGSLGLERLAAGRESGAYERFGVVSEERKGEMTEEFKEMGHLFLEEKDSILSSEKNLANFIRALEGLTVVGELDEQFNTFLASMLQKQRALEAGKVWDPEVDQFFQLGTGPQGFTVPSGYPNDTFRAGLSSGEKIFVEPKGMHGPQNITKGGDTWNLYVTIQGAPGGDTPRQLLDKLYQGLKNNAGSGTAKLKRLGVQING